MKELVFLPCNQELDVVELKSVKIRVSRNQERIANKRLACTAVKNEPISLIVSCMDKLPLPKTHELTKEEKAFVKSLDAKGQELHKLAIQWLETSYRPEWSHMWQKKA